MSTINPALGRVIAGFGGALLIAALFMPWSEAGGVTQSGWELATMSDVFFLITGACGLAVAITGARFGFFRSDLSFNAMTDIFGVVAAILIGWLILFDFPPEASREIGVYLALGGAAAIATGAGDFGVTSLYPRIPDAERSAR
jgi:hypothetical protein